MVYYKWNFFVCVSCRFKKYLQKKFKKKLWLESVFFEKFCDFEWEFLQICKSCSREFSEFNSASKIFSTDFRRNFNAKILKKEKLIVSSDRKIEGNGVKNQINRNTTSSVSCFVRP